MQSLTTFKGTQPSEAMSTGAARRSTVTDHECIGYIEVRKAPQTYGTCRDFYIVER